MDINRQAPAIAKAEGIIHAPLDLVWSVQTNLEQWQAWNPDVTTMDVRGPIKPGTAFLWKAGGVSIHSVLRVVESPRRIVWTGRTMGIHAVHAWNFQETEAGVHVLTEESFDGLLVKLLPGIMQRMLYSALEKGVQALKAESERRTVGEAPSAS